MDKHKFYITCSCLCIGIKELKISEDSNLAIFFSFVDDSRRNVPVLCRFWNHLSDYALRHYTLMQNSIISGFCKYLIQLNLNYIHENKIIKPKYMSLTSTNMNCDDDECTIFAKPGDCVDLNTDLGGSVIVSYFLIFLVRYGIT